MILSKDEIESPLAEELTRLSEANLSRCYQCGKCSAGCPVARYLDILPNRVLRLAQLGRFEEILTCRTIWICASCETCTARCPREVDVAAVMEALRQMALERGKAPRGAREITAFHKAFLDSVWAYGRLAEFTLVGDYKIRSGKFFQDVLTAPKMLRRGKLSFFPKLIAGRKEIRRIFKKCGY